MITREKARQIFAKSGIKYKNIEMIDMDVLSSFIRKDLKNHHDFPMTLVTKKSVNFNRDDGFESCHLFVNGEYFKKRQAISFERDGFIGFAEWASSKNAQPFVRAFIDWVKFLKGIKK